jgi:uncharacterized protein (DUF488 family)
VTTIRTVGHGTLRADALAALLRHAGVTELVDVRSFPGSRRNPQFARDAMEQWLPADGIGYRWLPALGGRRRATPGSRHRALRNDAFRGYADHMETPEFVHGADELVSAAEREPVAVMCSESVWWRCHRRLLADYLALVCDVEVRHLGHDGGEVPHPPTAGVRVVAGGLVYDVGTTPPLPVG